MFILAAFPQVMSGQRTFVFGDYGLFDYPLAYYWRQSFWRGEIPLWNPLSDCGLPFVGQWNPSTFYPLSLIYMIFPFPISLGYYALAHLFLAGLGMYFLASALTSNRFAGAVAGLAFAFSGLGQNCLMRPHDVASLGWMPWVLYFAMRAWRRGGRAVADAVVVGTMQMLVGMPEIILFTWIIVALMWVERLIEGYPTRPLILRRFAIVVAAVTGLAALQLLPFLDLLAHSHRDTNRVNTECAMPITGWANFLVPMFRCTGSPPGLFFQVGQFWTYSYYLSLVVVAGALCSVWLVRMRQVRLLAGLTVLCLVLALGDQGSLYTWLRRAFPPLNFINFPVKFVIPVTFCVPLLGAFAISEWQTAGVKNKSRVFRSAALVWIFAIGATLAILWYAHQFPKVYEQWPRMWKNGLTRVFFLTVTLATFYGVTKLTTLRQQVLTGLLALGLVWLDGLIHLPNLSPTVPPAVLKPGLPSFRKLVPLPRLGESRVMLSAPALKRFRTALLPDVANTYLGHRLGLYFNCNLLEDIPKAGGFYSLYLPEQVSTMIALYAPTNGIAPALADFLSVSQINSETNMLEWTARTSYLPMATAGQKPIFTDSTNSLLGLLAPDFNPREVVFLPAEAKAFLSATNRSEARVLSKSFMAHRNEMRVVAEQPSLLVVSQSFYHPWRGYVDGHPVQLWRANHAFQALEVPAGTHQVTLSYVDNCFRIGVLTSCLVQAAVWIAVLRRKPGLCLAREPRIA